MRWRVLRLALLAALVAAGAAGCGGAPRDAGTTDLAGPPPARMTLPPDARGITGASQARCSPAPCRPPQGHTEFTLPAVADDAGSSATREFGLVRPVGLVPTPANRAPAILIFPPAGGCGYESGGRFAGLATRGRFVVVAMEMPCPRRHWEKRNVDATHPTAPDDEPYVSAVLDAIERCPGPCVDPRRVYAAGFSSGGSMVADVMCDPENSARVRGYLIDSSSLTLFGGRPSCPSTNAGFFVMMALSNAGPDAGLFYDRAPHPHLDVRAFAAWAAARLRCRSSEATGRLGTAVTYTYAAPCAFARRGAAVIGLAVVNGGHGWSCQDSDPGVAPWSCPGMPDPPGLAPDGRPRTGGLFVESAFWQQMATGAS